VTNFLDSLRRLSGTSMRFGIIAEDNLDAADRIRDEIFAA
jgi:hypothetical protein